MPRISVKVIEKNLHGGEGELSFYVIFYYLVSFVASMYMFLSKSFYLFHFETRFAISV